MRADTPQAAAVPTTILSIFCGIARRSPRLNERAVPVSRTVLGMMLKAPAAVDAGDGDDGGVERRDLARHDALEGIDDARGRQDRVRGFVGGRAVASAAHDLDRELVDGRHEGSPVDADHADRQRSPEMEADRGADPLQRAGIVQACAPPRPSSAGWKRKRTGASAGVGREALGDGQRDGDVAVVAAGVHAPRLLGRVDAPALLPRAAARPCRRGAADASAPVPESARTPVFATPVRGSSPADASRPATRFGGAVLLERELGVTVQVPPCRNEPLVFVARERGEKFFEAVRHRPDYSEAEL